MQPFLFDNSNNSPSCFIYPRSKFPNGLYLTYETCPETYDNQTAKLIRYCCLSIMLTKIQDSLYKKTQDWLRYNSSTVLVVPAVLFNILSLAVLRRFQKLRGSSQTSTTFYMKCLCILDTLTIVSKFLYELIVVRNGLRTHPIVISSFLCKFLSFSESCCAISSIYLLIAMSIDKLICVLAPLKAGHMLTQSKARFTFSCILATSALISSYTLFDKRVFQFESDYPHDGQDPSNDLVTMTTKLNPIANQTFLDPVNHTKTSVLSKKRISYDCDLNWPDFKNNWVLINNIIRVFLPILLLCLCNSWIAIALAKASRNTEALFRDYSGRSRNEHMYSKTIRVKQRVNQTSYKIKRVFKFKKRS